MTVEIRPFSPGDEAALMDVCLRTGDAGGDASSVFADGDLVGTIWCLPYLRLAPELAFVVAAGDAAPTGYVLGALDTRAFADMAEERYWPEMRRRYPLDRFPADSMDNLLVHVIHDRSRHDDPELLARFPSHLHIDLLPETQGHGWGRRLVDRLLGELADRGSAGVHLGVSRANVSAIGFYRRLGFDEWSGPEGDVATFVRRLG